jgi:hypothetical protein
MQVSRISINGRKAAIAAVLAVAVATAILSGCSSAASNPVGLQEKQTINAPDSRADDFKNAVGGTGAGKGYKIYEMDISKAATSQSPVSKIGAADAAVVAGWDLRKNTKL